MKLVLDEWATQVDPEFTHYRVDLIDFVTITKGELFEACWKVYKEIDKSVLCSVRIPMFANHIYTEFLKAGFRHVLVEADYKLHELPFPFPTQMIFTYYLHNVLDPIISNYVKEMAAAFRHSRFFVDSVIPNESAVAIKKEWILNCLYGKRGETIFALNQAQNELCGFITTMGNRIDLIGVLPKYSGLGTGTNLIRQWFLCHRPLPLYAATNIANYNANVLYSKFGEISKLTNVLHLTVQKERT